MRVLIGILSCKYHRPQQQVVRYTWLKDISRFQNVSYKFFLGKELKGIVPEHDGSDEIVLDVPDNRRDLFKKTKGMIEYAVTHGYDYLFKCDVDTYCHILRLLSSGFERHDWIGYGEPFGGSGYWLSRKAMQALLANNSEWPTPEGEDSWVARNLKVLGFEAHQDPRYHSLTNEGPEESNEIITVHWYRDDDRNVLAKERLGLLAQYDEKVK